MKCPKGGSDQVCGIPLSPPLTNAERLIWIPQECVLAFSPPPAESFSARGRKGQKIIFSFFFFPSGFTSICNPLGYDRPYVSSLYMKLPGICPFIFHFCFISLLWVTCDFWAWVYPSRPSPADKRWFRYSKTPVSRERKLGLVSFQAGSSIACGRHMEADGDKEVSVFVRKASVYRDQAFGGKPFSRPGRRQAPDQ